MWPESKPAKALLLRRIWPRSFKWSRDRRKQKALGGKIKSWRFCCLDRSDLTMEKTTTVWWSLMSRWSLELILFTIESIAFVVLASSRAAARVSSASLSPPKLWSWSSFPLKKNLSQSKDANTEDVNCNKRLRTSRLQIFFSTLWISKICYW